MAKTQTYTLKLYPSGKEIGTMTHSDELMPHGAMGPTRLGSLPHDLYDIEEEYQDTHEDQLVYAE